MDGGNWTYRYSYQSFHAVFSPCHAMQGTPGMCTAHNELLVQECLVFDPTYPDISWSDFKHHDWEEFYGLVAEAIPPDAPKPLGKEIDIRMFVDSDHAGDKTNRRSQTGFMIFINMALVVWFSKRQLTIESSAFGAEFVALKNNVETLRGLRYKL